jgi:polysaccharide chain length determinant protein (PEP-CTERM system associated)
VSYVSVDPRLAMRVTERLASLFIEENLRDREVLAEGTNEFLESQLEDARRRLVEHEEKLADYRLRHADEMPGRLEANLQALHNAEMQVQALVNVLIIDRDRRRNVERQIAELADLALATEAVQKPVLREDDGSGQGTATVAATLASQRAMLAALELRLKPEHPDVIRTKRQIAELEKQEKLEAEMAAASGANGKDRLVLSPAERAREARLSDLRVSLDVMNREIASKEEQEARLREAIALYQQRAQAAPVRETELTDLTRDYQTIQQLYQNLLGKYESSKIAANLERRQQSEQFRVLEPAHLPERPFSPDRARLNLMGAALGLALGLGLTVVLEYFDTSLRSEDDVLLALGVPVLALVPYVVSQEEGLKLRRRKMIWGVTAATTAATTAAVVVWMLRL